MEAKVASSPRLRTRDIVWFELTLMVRDQWVMGFALVFAALLIGVAWFGISVSQRTGLMGFSRTTVSLLNLVIYLVPLMGVLSGVHSLTQRDRAGELIFSQPLSRPRLIFAKFIGQCLAMALGMLFAYSLTGAVIAMRQGGADAGGYILFAALSLLMAAASVGLGMVCAVVTRRSMAGYALGVLVWFFLVALYDLAVLGFGSVLTERAANQLFMYSIFLNPIDLVRVASLMALGGEEIFGVAGAKLAEALGGYSTAIATLTGALVVWALVPGGASSLILCRRDLI